MSHFKILDELITEIKNDIAIATAKLSFNDHEYHQFLEHIKM